MTTYTTGATVRVSAAFTTNGAAVDPSTVTCKIQNPSGTVTTYTYAGGTVTRDSLGNYHVDIDANQDGTWLWRFSSTGTGKAADEGRWFCKGELD